MKIDENAYCTTRTAVCGRSSIVWSTAGHHTDLHQFLWQHTGWQLQICPQGDCSIQSRLSEKLTQTFSQRHSVFFLQISNIFHISSTSPYVTYLYPTLLMHGKMLASCPSPYVAANAPQCQSFNDTNLDLHVIVAFSARDYADYFFDRLSVHFFVVWRKLSFLVTCWYWRYGHVTVT